MANKTLFASLRDALIPQTDTVNSENAPAYALAPKQALAQYAATGCFGRTFYTAANEQLTRVLELCDAVDSEFAARVAIYSRTQSFMKDMPALLCAWLPVSSTIRVTPSSRASRSRASRSARPNASPAGPRKFA
jgi:60 kDa SS-A/Ro ribonucleoprotein